MSFNCINSKKQGDIGLGCAIGWFTKNNYTVSVPLTDSQDYDLIVDDGSPLRVQVKTTKFREKDNDHYTAHLTTCGGNRSGTGKIKKFDPTKVELLFILTETGDMFLIPSNRVLGRTTINLGKLYEEFKVK